MNDNGKTEAIVQVNISRGVKGGVLRMALYTCIWLWLFHWVGCLCVPWDSGQFSTNWRIELLLQFTV